MPLQELEYVGVVHQAEIKQFNTLSFVLVFEFLKLVPLLVVIQPGVQVGGLANGVALFLTQRKHDADSYSFIPCVDGRGMLRQGTRRAKQTQHTSTSQVAKKCVVSGSSTARGNVARISISKRTRGSKRIHSSSDVQIGLGKRKRLSPRSQLVATEGRRRYTVLALSASKAYWLLPKPSEDLGT